ncbi:hypothetical protein [Halomonas sp. M4R1S46]|uniref:hypothetical protein n=1 Tax=Halomonas sp. M4R1S46 TaxID=2982692 RepID=UPI0021E4683B|nr:hypothetical protein [Halomonas sp. M4R1S46]UYG06404.1 hypothetical protein OCT48_12265 [Halomonas sp. M4R1S46]
MQEIELMPDPAGGWMAMCPCGAREIRAHEGPIWAAFDLRPLEGNRYCITCRECGHVTEHVSHQSAMGEACPAST